MVVVVVVVILPREESEGVENVIEEIELFLKICRHF